MKHLPALDGLRAIAVLSVVAYHAGLPVPAGFVGVDVFFVISGYLITRLLADEIRETGRIDFLHFYARRARRILPAAVLVVVVTLLLAFALLPEPADVAESAAAAAAFVANFHFQGVTGDYWAASSEQMPLLHLWSLSVEEQFYLLWPLLLIAVRKAALRWLACVALASLALAEALMYFNPDAAFYQMPARAWELALGGLVALRPLTLPRWSAGVGLLVVLASCFVPLPHFPGVGALPAVAGAALLIAAIHNGATVRVLGNAPLGHWNVRGWELGIGPISYSLYLWHWPLLALDRATRVGDAPLSVRLALCAVAFVLAALTYRYVETPFRRMQARPGRVVAAGMACVLLVGCAGLAGAIKDDPKPVPVVTYKRCPAFNPDAPEATNPSCNVTGPLVVVMGDSMAHAWQPVALAISGRLRIPLVTMTRDGCPIALGNLKLRSRGEARRCMDYNTERLAYIAAHKPEVVVLAGRWEWLLQHNPEFGAGVVSMVGAIALHAKQVIILGPSPEMLDSPARCAALSAKCDVRLADHLAQSERARAIMARLAGIPGVSVVDTADWLCTDGACPAISGSRALYTDTFHPTQTTTALIAQEMVPRLSLRP